ncbi:MAG: Rrf2 family transcriptional regulator [Actinobacteria bacterium]|nr:Rrf2 family transcriptional regulator [Actinomycetota bacterium]MCG2807996.1 Rrf2 family transcriptional regulator [Coriobacteriia bacterium]
MPVQWRTDYAVRLMYEAARLGADAMATVQHLAEAGSVPYDFARQIANELVRSGLMVSRRGARGGVGLARPAEHITIHDIFIAMGERTSLSLCTSDPSVCARSGDCPMHNGIWRELDEMIEHKLSSVTLAHCVACGSPTLGMA